MVQCWLTPPPTHGTPCGVGPCGGWFVEVDIVYIVYMVCIVYEVYIYIYSVCVCV